MPSFAHKKIAEQLQRLDTPPRGSAEFQSWIQASSHLDFLRSNALTDEIVLYASPEYSFIHAMVVPNEHLFPIDSSDLLGASCSPSSGVASYVYGGGREGVWLERGPSGTGSKTLNQGMELVFGRTFEGWSGPGASYYELNQEFTHVCGIHWRSEHRAYCCYDDRGDLAQVVSITGPKANRPDISLVTCQAQPLEEYLSAASASLVRMFDFTLLKYGEFVGWPPGDEELSGTEDFMYRQKVAPGIGAYTHGYQILRPTRARKPSWGRTHDGPFQEFIAYDFRHARVSRISTDPKATTNYFQAKENDLPFELSPAFFRPEVLLKYKMDRDKYTMGERDIICRAAWYLKGFDVNEAGQVFAYICYLRSLPYQEQQHWASFNEEPKAGISARAIQNDFKGEFTDHVDPLLRVLGIVSGWHTDKKAWWKLRVPNLMERVSKPVSSSRDEWADACMDLSKLVVEGFVVDDLRERLTSRGISFDKQAGSISLLEQWLRATETDSTGLFAMRTVQKVRTKVKGHAGHEEADAIVLEAIQTHGGLPQHFAKICEDLAAELERVAASLD